MSDHNILIIWVMKIFFVQFFCVFLPPLLISSASVRPIPFLSFIEPIFVWNVPLVSLLFLKRSLVFPILLFSSISLHWSRRKAFLSLLAILLPFVLLPLWNYVRNQYQKVFENTLHIFKCSVTFTQRDLWLGRWNPH